MVKYSGHWLQGLLLMIVLGRCSGQVSCPSGDTAGIIQDGKTCSELVTEAISNCYTVETLCCQSCNDVNTGVASCKYGDSTSCFTYLCGKLADPSQCCATCATTTVGAPTAAPTTTVAAPTAAPTTTVAATGGGGGGESATGESSNDSVGKIVGGTIGGTVGAAAVVGVVFAIAKKLKSNKVTDDEKTVEEEGVTVVPDGTGYDKSEMKNEKITHVNGDATILSDNVKTNTVNNGDPFCDPRKHSLPALDPKSVPDTEALISPRNFNPLPPIGTHAASS